MVIDIFRRLIEHVDEPSTSKNRLAQTKRTDALTKCKGKEKVTNIITDEAASSTDGDPPKDPDAKAMRELVASQASADKSDEIWNASYLRPFVRFSTNMTTAVIEMIKKSPQKQM